MAETGKYWRRLNPSRPGEPPHVDTGRLRASITYDVETGTEPAVHIGSFHGVQYAAYLEIGTSRMAARPYLRPALDMNKDRILSMLAGEA